MLQLQHVLSNMHLSPLLQLMLSLLARRIGLYSAGHVLLSSGQQAATLLSLQHFILFQSCDANNAHKDHCGGRLALSASF